MSEYDDETPPEPAWSREEVAEWRDALEAVRSSSDAVRAAELYRDTQIRSAKDSGAPITLIADAAMLARPTIYRIVGRSLALPPKSRWREILRDGLNVQMQSCSEQGIAWMAAALKSSEEVMADRLLQGRRMMTSVPRYGSASWEVLRVAGDVAEAIIDRRGQDGA